MKMISKAGIAGGRLAVLLLLLTAALPLSAGPAGALNPRPICEVCRRYTDTSPGRAQAAVKIDRHTKTLDSCSLFCLLEQLEDYEDEPLWIQVMDYPSFDTDQQLVLRNTQAQYLYDADSGSVEKTHLPFIYAFSSEDTAADYQDELGGELLEWDEVLEQVLELTEEWEPDPPEFIHRPLRHPRH
jgi:hypothetical protein